MRINCVGASLTNVVTSAGSGIRYADDIDVGKSAISMKGAVMRLKRQSKLDGKSTRKPIICTGHSTKCISLKLSEQSPEPSNTSKNDNQ